MMYVVISTKTNEALYVTADLNHLKRFLVQDIIFEQNKSLTEERLNLDALNIYSENIKRILEEEPSDEGIYMRSINYYAHDIHILPETEVQL